MADIKEVDGIFGGADFGAVESTGNEFGFNGNNTEYAGNGVGFGEESIGKNARRKELPVKTGFWSKFKAVMFKEIPWNYEIKVVLTPYQQKVEDEINEFLHQEITWEKVHDFLFQEISFGKKKSV